MSQINNLIDNYRHFVGLPWQKNLAGIQRVWLAVYSPSEERRLRARLKEFEIATEQARHKWKIIDITHVPAQWLAAHDYREGYFATPEALDAIEEELKEYVVSRLIDACLAEEVDTDTVLAVLGAGSLFGFTYVSAIISQLESSIRGRLLVFFPGEYERNYYRFMDARDGFNYMAVPITCTTRMAI